MLHQEPRHAARLLQCAFAAASSSCRQCVCRMLPPVRERRPFCTHLGHHRSAQNFQTHSYTDLDSWMALDPHGRQLWSAAEAAQTAKFQILKRLRPILGWQAFATLCLDILGLLLTMRGSLLGRFNIGLRKGGSTCAGHGSTTDSCSRTWFQPSRARSQEPKPAC